MTFVGIYGKEISTVQSIPPGVTALSDVRAVFTAKDLKDTTEIQRDFEAVDTSISLFCTHMTTY